MSKRYRAAALKSGYVDTSHQYQSAETRSTKRFRSESPENVCSPIKALARSSTRTIGDSRGAKQISRLVRTRRNDSSDQQKYNILNLPNDILLSIFSFIVSPAKIDIDTLSNIQGTCRQLKQLTNSHELWWNIPAILPNGSLNIDTMSYMKRKSQGTEGICYQAFCRRTQSIVALKKARVYPDNEGVPYYMMRELAALKKLNHPNICILRLVNLHNYKLYLIYDYVEKTLYDYLMPNGCNEPATILKKHQIKHIMIQLLSAVSYCHERGIMHRNLKPKHLLIIPGSGLDPLDHCIVQLADFALVRVLMHPPRQYTTEVITLWYRPPEILLGQRNYTTAVDMWSIGCIYGELLTGKPLFAGLCEIDQLFQIFHKLGTPNGFVWPSFESLPYYQSLFPHWEKDLLESAINGASDKELHLLKSFLKYNPMTRITANEALSHSYFTCDTNPETRNMIHTLNQSDTITDTKIIELSKSAMAANTTLQQYLFLRKLELDTAYMRPYYKDCRRRRSATHMNSIDEEMESIYHTNDLYICLFRQDVVESLIDIMDTIPLHMCVRTVFFAVAIFDRFLSTRDHPFDIVQEYELLGSTCLHIASKCEDVSYISVKDLAIASHNISDGSLILKTEEIVLNALNFDLYYPTVIDFVGYYLDCIPEVMNNEQLSEYAEYFSEASLIFPVFVGYAVSLIATAIISYALICCNANPWPTNLEYISMYKKPAVIPVIQLLHRMHSRMNEFGINSVVERYARKGFRVSTISPPSIIPNMR
jgi:cyclin-dependent kinase 2